MTKCAPYCPRLSERGLRSKIYLCRVETPVRINTVKETFTQGRRQNMREKEGGLGRWEGAVGAWGGGGGREVEVTK